MLKPEIGGAGFQLPSSLLLILLPLCMNLVLLSVLSLQYLQRFQEKTHKILSAFQWSVYLLISVLISVFQMNAAQMQMLLLLSMVSTWLFGAVLYQRTEQVQSFLPGVLSIAPPAMSIFLHHLNIPGWDGVLTLLFIPMLHLSIQALRTQEPSSWVNFTEFTQQLSTPVIITNAEHQVKFINPAALSLQVSPSGVFTIDHLRGLQHQEMVHASRSETIFEVSLEGNLHYRVQLRPLPGALTCYTLQQVRKKPSITEGTSKRDHLEGHLDEWTGTPNFLAFADHLHTLALNAEHTAKLRTWVCWVDIDSSATVLAMLGAQRAQQALIRLLEVVRRHSGGEVFRIEQDRLGFFMPGSEEKIVACGDRIRQAVRDEAHGFFGEPVRVTATLLAVRFRKHNHSVEEVLDTMEFKIREVQRNGGNATVLVRDTLEVNVKHPDREVYFAIQRALEGQIRVDFQPIQSLQQGMVVAYEALLRIHDGEGWQPPRYFGRVASQHRLWSALDWKVVGVVVEQVKATGRVVFVNLHPDTITHLHFVEAWTGLLEQHGLLPHLIGIEVLEGTVFTARLKNTLKKLHHLGVPVALDDFGTGSLGLQHLAELPLTHVKISREVLRTALNEGEKRQVLSSILAMCRAFGHPVVLEGVSSPAAWQVAREEGCEFVQGYAAPFEGFKAVPCDLEMAPVLVDPPAAGDAPGTALDSVL